MPARNFYDQQQAGAPKLPTTLLPKSQQPGRGRNRQQAAQPGPPLLTIRPDGRCTLSKALQAAAGLAAGAAFSVVVPRRRAGQWYLDTRPRPGAGCQLPASHEAKPVVRLPPIARHHFVLGRPVGVGQGQITANRNELRPHLRFVLGLEVAGHPGYYQLLPWPPPAGAVNHNGPVTPAAAGGAG